MAYNRLLRRIFTVVMEKLKAQPLTSKRLTYLSSYYEASLTSGKIALNSEGALMRSSLDFMGRCLKLVGTPLGMNELFDSLLRDSSTVFSWQEKTMSFAATQPRYTPEQYLALERKAEFKSEYINGHIVTMAGASRRHNLIAGNLYREVSQQLRGRPCEAYIGDMRVKVSPTGLYTYPDVVAVCGEFRFEDADNDTLLNPTVIVEVLSASTEAYDRGEKFAHYRQLESLQEYLLVAQDKVRVEHYVRQGVKWLLSEASDLHDTVHLAAIDCAIALQDVYDKVQFAESEASPLPNQGMEPRR